VFSTLHNVTMEYLCSSLLNDRSARCSRLVILPPVLLPSAIMPEESCTHDERISSGREGGRHRKNANNPTISKPGYGVIRAANAPDLK